MHATESGPACARNAWSADWAHAHAHAHCTRACDARACHDLIIIPYAPSKRPCRLIEGIFVCTHTHTHTHTPTHPHTYACMHACIHAYMHTYTHTYINTHIHRKHTHICFHLHYPISSSSNFAYCRDNSMQLSLQQARLLKELIGQCN
jgi:hypothetical protein